MNNLENNTCYTVDETQYLIESSYAENKEITDLLKILLKSKINKQNAL